MLPPFSASCVSTALGLFALVILCCVPLATNLAGLDQVRGTPAIDAGGWRFNGVIDR